MPATWIGLLLLGLLGGWIVNYLADVLPTLERLGSPVCQHCGAAFAWQDYLFVHRCRSCGLGRGLRTFIVQIAMPLAFVYLWQAPPHQLELPLAIMLVLYLTLVVLIDIEHRFILTATSIFGALLGAGIGAHLHGLVPTLLGGAAGYGAMLILYLLGGAFVRYVSRRRGEPVNEVALGFGDVSLAGIAGLFLGWPGIAFGLILTVFAGGAFSLIFIAIMLLRRRYHAFSAIPYGPFLALSIAVLLLRP